MKIAFTIITADYFANAIALGDSILKNNPDYTYIIGLLDKREHFPNTNFSTNYTVIEYEEFNDPNFQGMYERYNLFELVCALKPYFADHIAQKYTPDIILYFDSDMLVFNKLIAVEEALIDKAVALTPHICQPMLVENSNENLFLQAGIFNGGFFGLNMRRKTSGDFLKWWKEKLKHDSIIAIYLGLFVDQKWLDLSVTLFDDIYIIKNPGYNIGHYNLHERKLSLENNIYLVNNIVPLVIYHYTGYDWKNPELISKYSNRYTLSQREDLREVLKSYSILLKNNNIEIYEKLKSYYLKPFISRANPVEVANNELRRLINEKDEIIDAGKQELENSKNELETKEKELKKMKESLFWKLGEKYWSVRNIFFKAK